MTPTESGPSASRDVASSRAENPYVSPVAVPTQDGPAGIRFDFNMGARVRLPPRGEGSWRIRLRDLDTGNILFESRNQGAFVNSSKRWFVRFRIELWDDTSPDPAWVHDYDASGQEILIQFPIGTLGDTLAWMPYAARFAQRRQARVTCCMAGRIIPLFRDAYPDIRFVTPEELASEEIRGRFYASYYLGLFFTDEAHDWQPVDFRHVGLHRSAGYILGVSSDEEPARISIPDDGRPLAEPYVCIGVQASTGAKLWNNPAGWRAVVTHLKRRGLRVVCIDQRPVHGTGLTWNHIPHGVEDETGDRPLTERARWLAHAEAFIGLSSGLGWLAWSAGCPVVMISGFTAPTNEFATPGRVITWHSCNSCWNDPRHRFDHKDFFWCPRHKDTARQFECTRLITPESVIAALDRVLAVNNSRGPEPRGPGAPMKKKAPGATRVAVPGR